jgi:phosphate transport system substrate-binding protein
MKKISITFLFLVFLFSGVLFASSRNYISIVGSSTVYPFATTVAEHFGQSTKFKTPKIESTGSGGGFKLFCGGIGTSHPDITNASRAIKQSEIDMCKENGVTDIIEVKIGYDGIVIANSKKAKRFDLTRKELFLALAKEVPSKDGKFIPNPNKTWKDINPAFPDVKIEVIGPPPTSGTRDAFVELVMDEGAKEFPEIKAIKDKKLHKAISQTIREDGVFIEAGENDNLIIQKLEANPDALGIFGFSYLDQNTDKIQGSLVDGVQPTFENIADGSYPVSRPLFFYVKKAHINSIPGMKEYINEFTSDKAWGENGYLSEKGLIPMPKDEKDRVKADVNNLTTIK